jgi:hypothetical protein
MKRRFLPLTLLFVFLAVLAVGSDARRSGSHPIPTPENHVKDLKCSQVSNKEITEISECPDTGCSKATESHPFDTLLNQVKNVPLSNKTAETKDYSYLHDRPNPPSSYQEGDERQALEALGEGKMIRVMAYATRVSQGSSETCNCNLTTMADKDNHIVLFDPGPDPNHPKPPAGTVSGKVAEKKSQTAEFTPRLRLTHPTLKYSNLNAWIQAATGHKLLVRVTGLQMFDSHHLFHDPLPRHNNWEIHPAFRLEFCPKGNVCTRDSDANWVDLKPGPKVHKKSKAKKKTA